MRFIEIELGWLMNANFILEIRTQKDIAGEYYVYITTSDDGFKIIARDLKKKDALDLVYLLQRKLEF